MWPESKVYAQRKYDGKEPTPSGSMEMFGKVVNLYAQIEVGRPIDYPNPRNKFIYDTAENRLHYFKEALAAFAIATVHAEDRSLALPYGIGCVRAGGDWTKYQQAISDFAKDEMFGVTLYWQPDAHPREQQPRTAKAMPCRGGVDRSDGTTAIVYGRSPRQANLATVLTTTTKLQPSTWGDTTLHVRPLR